jgi:hypothetical protein
MRSILLATALAFAALVPATLQIAEACGSYEWYPEVLPVSTHSAKGEKTASFVLFEQRLDAKAAAKLRWTRLDLMSFDTTATAPAMKDAPFAMTLVGPAGTKVVKASQLVWVDVAFDHDGPRLGFRIPEGDFRIAVRGERTDATWESFTETWGEGIKWNEGGGLDMVTDGNGVTKVNSPTMKVTFEGHPRGILKMNGGSFLIYASNTARDSIGSMKI